MKKRLSVKLVKFIIKDWLEYYKACLVTINPNDDLFNIDENYYKGWRDGQIDALKNILFILKEIHDPIFAERYLKEKPSKENPE